MMFKSKNTLLYLLLAFAIVFTLWYYWNKSSETESLDMPQQDTYWKQVSGEYQFRNQVSTCDNDIDTKTPYTQIPMQSDTRFITGMNKYLCDKHKGDAGCETCG